MLWVTCTQVFHPPLSLCSFYPSVYQLRTTHLLSLVVSTLCHQLLSLSQCPLFFLLKFPYSPFFSLLLFSPSASEFSISPVNLSSFCSLSLLFSWSFCPLLPLSHPPIFWLLIPYFAAFVSQLSTPVLGTHSLFFLPSAKCFLFQSSFSSYRNSRSSRKSGQKSSTQSLKCYDHLRS